MFAGVCQEVSMLARIIWVTVNNQHLRCLQVVRDDGSFLRFDGDHQSLVVHPFITLTPVGGSVGAEVTIPKVP